MNKGTVMSWQNSPLFAASSTFHDAFSRSDFGEPNSTTDHQSLAAYFLQKLVAGDHPGKRKPKFGAALGGCFDQFLRFDHFKRGDAGRHRQIVLRKRRTVHHRAVHLIEDLVEDVLAREHCANRHVAAGERL